MGDNMKKGFTLVELLAVIVVLGVILAIAIPNVLNIIEKTRIDAIIKNEEMMINAAKKYLVSNTSILPVNVGDTIEVTLDNLKTNRLIDSIKNPRNNQECNGYILVTKVNTTDYEYKPRLDCETNRGSASSDGLILYYGFDDFQEPTQNINNNVFFVDINGVPTVVPYGSWGFGDHNNTILTSLSDSPAIGNGRSAKVERSGIIGGATIVRAGMIHPSLIYGDKISTSWYVKGVGNSIGKTVERVWGYCNGPVGAVSTGKISEYVLTSEWQRVEYVFMWTRSDSNSHANCLNTYIRVAELNVGDYFLVSNPQVELKAHVTPFVNGTRTGTVKDYSGNGRDATLLLTTTPRWVNEGIGKGSYQFDGNVTYALLPSISMTTNAVTVQLRTRLNKLPNEIVDSFAGIFDSASDHYIIYLDKSSNELRFKVTTSVGAERPGIPTSMLTKNEWLQITGTYDGISAKIYLNGNLVDTHSLPGGIISGSHIAALGRNGTDAISYFEGSVDEVKIYNRALTDAEIKQLYQNAISR